jgi:hypothetical protein
MFCACEIIQLFSAVFYVIRAVHKFNFGLVINETTNEKQCKNHAVTEAKVE